MGVSYFYLFLGCLFWVFLFPFYFIYLIKMEKLENLLNYLIQRGRKPFENSNLNHCNSDGKFIYFYTIRIPNKPIESLVYESLAVPLRLITTIESGLWKFVCQNKLLSDKVDLQDYIEDSFWFRRCPFDTNWMYRIMQSSLYSEKDLPQFLIDNIKL